MYFISGAHFNLKKAIVLEKNYTLVTEKKITRWVGTNRH